MKGFVSIFIFLCLALLGAQDITNVDTFNPEPDVQLHSIEKAVKDKAIKHHQEIAFDLPGTCDYTQILSKSSRDRGNMGATFRLLYKHHSSLLLKVYNTRQRTCELLSSSLTIINSSLHYRYAHFVYELQRIII